MKSFDEIYNIVKPAETPSAWDLKEQRNVELVAERTRSADEVLLAMKLFPSDWTRRSRNKMARLLWGEEGCQMIGK